MGDVVVVGVMVVSCGNITTHVDSMTQPDNKIVIPDGDDLWNTHSLTVSTYSFQAASEHCLQLYYTMLPIE